MKEENKLIAEFMGYTLDTTTKEYYIPKYNSGDWFTIDELLFHDSWDWLMPVVSEIKTIGNIGDRFYEGLDRLDTSIMEVDIELAYQNVVDIIEWYNENK